MGNRAKLNTQTQLTYNKVIAEKHTLDALIGFETEDYKYDYVYANGNTYPSYLPEIEMQVIPVHPAVYKDIV